ncbi:MAG: tetratricopeptide repeat protein [Candidatus Bruticola sp.]
MTRDIDSISSADELLELAEQLEDDDNLEEALKAVEKAIKLAPQNGKAYCAKSSLLQDMDKPSEAFKVLTQACKDMPENTDCFFELGAFLSEHDNISQAAGCFDKVNKLDPNYPKIKVHLGNCLLKLGHWTEAIECLTEALNTELSDKDKARVLNHIGEAHMNNIHSDNDEANKKELETAKEFFDKAVELDPDDYIPFGNMAMTYCRMGEPESAVKILEPIIAKYPDQAKLYVINGISLALIAERQAEAIASFEKAIELDPESPELWFHKAHYYVRRNEFDKALAVFEEGLKALPNSGQLHLQISSLLRHLADIENSLGHKEEGQARFNASIAHHREGLRLLGRLVHWGFFFVDENNKPVEGTNIAIESDRAIPREKVAEQYVRQLKEQGHTVSETGLIDGKYRIGMAEIPPDRVKLDHKIKVL